MGRSSPAASPRRGLDEGVAHGGREQVVQAGAVEREAHPGAVVDEYRWFRFVGSDTAAPAGQPGGELGPRLERGVDGRFEQERCLDRLPLGCPQHLGEGGRSVRPLVGGRGQQEG